MSEANRDDKNQRQEEKNEMSTRTKNLNKYLITE